MQALLFTLLYLLTVSAAGAQAVQQSGTVVPGHQTQWITNGVIGDGGSLVVGSSTANDALCVNGSGSIFDCGVPLATGIGSGRILVGTNTGVPAWVAMSGDCTLASTGVITCSAFGATSLGAAPTAAQILIAQSGAAYAPKTISGDCTVTLAGVISCTKTGGTSFGALATSGSPCIVSVGCTGLTTLTANAVMLGAGTSTVNFAAIGTAGRLLIDKGVSTNPAFTAMSGDCTLASSGAITCYATPATVAKGGTGDATLTAHSVLIGEGTSAIASATIGTAGRLLIDQGASADPSFNALSGSCTVTSGGVITCLPLVKFTKFLTGPTATYTADTHLIKAKLECIGGGGGGGGAAASATGVSSGGGGGGGGYSLLWATAATIGTSQTVTIASAAAGGAAGNNAGADGGDTSIGSLVVGKGGTHGTGAGANGAAAAGLGGVAGTGDFTAVGSPGGIGLGASIATVFGPSGAGGGTHYGGGAIAVSGSASAADGGAGTVYGSGGAGAQSQGSASAGAGGAGALGMCMVTEYTSQ